LRKDRASARFQGGRATKATTAQESRASREKKGQQVGIGSPGLFFFVAAAASRPLK
jgi:hypothetical protein